MKPKAVVLTASIDNEDDIRRWVDTVGEAARAVNDALDALRHQLAEGPHIAFTLHQHKPEAE